MFSLFQELQWLVDIEVREFVGHLMLVDSLLIELVPHQFQFRFVQIGLGFLLTHHSHLQPPFFVLLNAR